MLDLGWGDSWSSQAGLLPNISQSSEGTEEETCTGEAEGCPETHDDASFGTGYDFAGAWSVLERRTTVKDLLKMKRQIQDEIFLRQLQEEQYLTGPNMKRSGAHSGQTPEQMDTAQNYSFSELLSLEFEPGDPPAPPHNSPEHMDNPRIAPRNPSPQHMDVSPTHTLTNPSTAYPNLPAQPYSAPCSSPPQQQQSGPNCPPQQQQSASARPPITTLFQWQVQQQMDKIKGVPPEMINMQDSDGDTPLHIAVAQGKRALAYVLAANMAVSGTLDLPEHNGQTALHIAAATDQPLMVCDLLEYGAQVHKRDAWGRSPLHVCVEKGHVHSLQSMFRTLKAAGKDFDVDLSNYDGLTPLHVAVLAHNATFRQLSALGRSCSGGEREGLLKKEHALLECVKALLQMGASCGAKDQKSGRTCVHMAAEAANTQLLCLLLNQPLALTVINQRTFSGNTALHIVCALQGRGTQLEAVMMLMKRGADPGARNYENELPCQLLPEGGRAERVRQILKGRYFHI